MPKSQHSPNPPSPNAEKVKEGEKVIRLIRELATKPPVKDVASVRAASEVFEANIEKTTDEKKGDALPPAKDAE